MIYFDNAATGGFKPNAVIESITTANKYLLANPGRSGHRLSLTCAKAIFQTRQTLSNFFGAEPERVIFTKNCTEALNVAIFGCVKKGGHVVASTFEHNSVLRPLFHLQSLGIISLTIASPSKDISLLQAVKNAVKDNTYMVVCSAVSNVTGDVLPIKELGEFCAKRNLFFLVDGAQGGGHIKLNLKEQKINALALAGHKGLYGIMGSGALIFDSQTEILPLMHGGTGVDTFNKFQPTTYPERLEAGTLNLPAILALNEGVNYAHKNLDCFASHLLFGTNKIINALSQIEKITVYSKPNPAGIVAFSLNGIASPDLADVLSTEYDVATRGGFHCAPLTHTYLNTQENGLLRVSIAVQNSMSEIDYFIKSISKIALNPL